MMKDFHTLKCAKSHSVSVKHIPLFLVFVDKYVPLTRISF